MNTATRQENTTTTPPRTPPELWTVTDVAAYMRVSKSWVYKNYRQIFTVYRTGQLVRFDPNEVQAAVRDFRQQPPAKKSTQHEHE